MYDDVLQRNADGELEIRTVTTTGDTSTNKDDVFTRDEQGRLCIRITGAGGGGGGGQGDIVYDQKLNLLNTDGFAAPYIFLPTGIADGNYELYYKVKKLTTLETSSPDSFAETIFKLKFNVSTADGTQKVFGSVCPVFDGNSALGSQGYWGTQEQVFAQPDCGINVFSQTDGRIMFQLPQCDFMATNAYGRYFDTFPDKTEIQDCFAVSKLKNIDTKTEQSVTIDLLGGETDINIGYLSEGCPVPFAALPNVINSTSENLIDLTVFGVEVLPVIQFNRGKISETTFSTDSIFMDEVIEFVALDESESPIGYYRAILKTGYQKLGTSEVEKTGVFQNSVVCFSPDAPLLSILNKDRTNPLASAKYVFVHLTYPTKNTENESLRNLELVPAMFDNISSTFILIPEEITKNFALKITDTLTQAIANAETYNIITSVDLATDASFEANLQKSEYQIVDGAIKLPAIEKYVDYGIEVRLNGAFAGGENTNREFTIQLQRADGSIVSEKAVVKVAGNDLSKSSVVFETYTNTLEDPFIASGLKIVVNNTSGQTLNLTGCDILIKARA